MSDQMSDPGKRRLVVVLGETELTAEVRAALEVFPWPVRYVEDPEALAQGADPNDLVLTSLRSSQIGERAGGPSVTSGDTDADRQVRARSPNPFAPNRLYEEAHAYVEETLASVRDSADPDVDRGRLLAERMHTDLLRDNSLINRTLEPHEIYDLASHCVNVAVLGGKIALGMVSGVEDAVEVIHAGLLHDIGMAKLPPAMLRNQGAWSEREQEALRQHPVYGAEILERCAPRCEWLRRAVLQEHERAQGQGYPYGLFDRDLDPIARILGVADVFEALSHPRTYRSPFTALQALERVVGMQDDYFAAQVVSALVNEISAFPMDSYVQISSGEIGRVVATDPGNILRPRVELVWDADWKRIEEAGTLDLASRPELTVARALLESELPIT
ncbi:MAG: HD domain-containing protein [Gemmatimonadetes bacterium]|nr:HD domain-containing protein [Gemmatimonadota bacterium]